MQSIKMILFMAFIAFAGTLIAAESSQFAGYNKSFSTSAFYQNPQGQQMSPQERAKQETEWMKTDLSLNPQQIVKVDSINLKYARKRSEMRSQMQGMDREAMMPKFQELQNQKNAELKPVLTEEQMKKYLELLPQRRGPRGQGRGAQS